MEASMGGRIKSRVPRIPETRCSAGSSQIRGEALMRLQPKNWRDFQHYKNRNPPWIRLHRSLLDNLEFHRLPVASRALAPLLWLLASESTDGLIDANPENLSFRLRMSEKEINSAIRPLIDKGFFVVLQDASNTLAEGLRDADSETEAETEEIGAKAPVLAVGVKPKPRRSSRVPEDFQPDLAMAVREIPDIDAVREAQKFRDWEFKTPRSDWEAVWRNWVETCRESGKYARAATRRVANGLEVFRPG
jgi:hypothetical protein